MSGHVWWIGPKVKSNTSEHETTQNTTGNTQCCHTITYMLFTSWWDEKWKMKSQAHHRDVSQMSHIDPTMIRAFRKMSRVTTQTEVIKRSAQIGIPLEMTVPRCCFQKRTVMLLDSSSSPHRSYQLLVNMLTSTPDSCSYSPSCLGSEESEITYSSQTVLLQISSSSSSSTSGHPTHDSPADDTRKKQTDCGACAEITLDSSNAWESCDSYENNNMTPCERIPPYHQDAYADGPSLTYQYANSSKDVIQAVKNIRVPDEIKQWAAEYLHQMDVHRLYPVKRKRLQ
ncbi:uncharacterized protein [Pyxicephalus adspersus]|uniref:uncharacterized protein n=1 Tax=Pyxicephalus adspersus TaxID=30357 RepID=UPI003B5A1974